MSEWLENLAEPGDVPHTISEVYTALTCEAKHRFRYVLRLPEPVSPRAEWGTAFHAVVERYLTTGEPGEMLPDIAEAWEAFRPIAERLQGSKSEVPVSYTLAGIRFTGRLDVIDPQGAVHDVKTKGRRPDDAEIRQNIQLTAYAEALRQLTGEIPPVWWDVLVRNKKPVAESYMAERTRADIAKLERAVERIFNRIERGEAVPRITRDCQFCDYKERCDQEYE